jgi:hypothetical protein
MQPCRSNVRNTAVLPTGVHRHASFALGERRFDRQGCIETLLLNEVTVDGGLFADFPPTAGHPIPGRGNSVPARKRFRGIDAPVPGPRAIGSYEDLMANNGAAKELILFAKNRLNKFYNPKLHKDCEVFV